MDNIQVCPVCGIQKFGESFRWSFTGKVATSNDLFTKVCKVGAEAEEPKDMSGCINKSGKFDKNFARKPITREFIDGLITGAIITQEKLNQD